MLEQQFAGKTEFRILARRNLSILFLGLVFIKKKKETQSTEQKTTKMIVFGLRMNLFFVQKILSRFCRNENHQLKDEQEIYLNERQRIGRIEERISKLKVKNKVENKVISTDFIIVDFLQFYIVSHRSVISRKHRN